MIRTATSVLNELVTAMRVGKRHGLVEVLDGVPSAHAGNGQFVPVINDSAGGVSYWRSDGAASIADISAATGCANAVRVSMPMALIGFVRRDQCDDMEAVLQAAVIQLRAGLRPLRNSIAGVFSTGIGSVSMGVDVVRTSEITDFVVPTSLAVLSMRFTLTVDGSDDCLADACTPGDPICALIQGLRWSRIEGCLTPTQREQAIESLCDGGGPCDPIDIQLNGVSVVAPECGDTIDIPVLNTLGTPVGSWNGTRWLAPSGQAQLRDTDNNPIATAPVPSNTAVALTAPNAVANVINSVPTVLATLSILSGQAANIPLADVINIDSDGTPVPTPAGVPFVATPCGGACPYDGIIQINGVPVDTFGPFDPCVNNTLTLNLAGI